MLRLSPIPTRQEPSWFVGVCALANIHALSRITVVRNLLRGCSGNLCWCAKPYVPIHIHAEIVCTEVYFTCNVFRYGVEMCVSGPQSHYANAKGVVLSRK